MKRAKERVNQRNRPNKRKRYINQRNALSVDRVPNLERSATTILGEANIVGTALKSLKVLRERSWDSWALTFKAKRRNIPTAPRRKSIPSSIFAKRFFDLGSGKNSLMTRAWILSVTSDFQSEASSFSYSSWYYLTKITHKTRGGRRKLPLVRVGTCSRP